MVMLPVKMGSMRRRSQGNFLMLRSWQHGSPNLPVIELRFHLQPRDGDAGLEERCSSTLRASHPASYIEDSISIPTPSIARGNLGLVPLLSPPSATRLRWTPQKNPHLSPPANFLSIGMLPLHRLKSWHTAKNAYNSSGVLPKSRPITTPLGRESRKRRSTFRRCGCSGRFC